jgi:hypothetical protein
MMTTEQVIQLAQKWDRETLLDNFTVLSRNHKRALDALAGRLTWAQIKDDAVLLASMSKLYQEEKEKRLAAEELAEAYSDKAMLAEALAMVRKNRKSERRRGWR